MKVLVACEFSGIVRDAFRARGHDAYSCDILPCEADPQWHFQEDIIRLLMMEVAPWDLMIAHPPCTHLAVSGARWFKDKVQEQEQALGFVKLLLNAYWIPRIALENPVSIISTRIRKPDQVIQPWQFGHYESKATCLWLKGLPTLRPTNVVLAEQYGCKCGYKFSAELGKYGCPNCEGEWGAAKPIYRNQTPTGQNNVGPGPEQKKIRSRTYPGIAAAMADQWGSL